MIFQNAERENLTTNNTLFSKDVLQNLRTEKEFSRQKVSKIIINRLIDTWVNRTESRIRFTHLINRFLTKLQKQMGIG